MVLQQHVMPNVQTASFLFAYLYIGLKTGSPYFILRHSIWRIVIY